MTIQRRVHVAEYIQPTEPSHRTFVQYKYEKDSESEEEIFGFNPIPSKIRIFPSGGKALIQFDSVGAETYTVESLDQHIDNLRLILNEAKGNLNQ